MEDALPLFALAASLCSLALVIWTAGRVWHRAKELEHTASLSLDPDAAGNLSAILAQIDARLRRLELSVDATAIEVERVAESQRFATRALAADGPAGVRQTLG
jgi:hypothetical protein